MLGPEDFCDRLKPFLASHENIAVIREWMCGYEDITEEIAAARLSGRVSFATLQEAKRIAREAATKPVLVEAGKRRK